MNHHEVRLHAKGLIRAFLPRKVIALLKQLRSARLNAASPEWEYIPGGWEVQKNDLKIKGWNVDSVRDAYLNRWPDFVSEMQGEAPFGGEDIVRQTVILSYAYALARASAGRGDISMLDWGGGVGSYLLLSHTLFPTLTLDYHCKDVSVLAEHGQILFPNAHFYSDETCFARSYHFVLASCSLHYSFDWQSVLTRLASSASKYLFVTRHPICHQAGSYVFVQRPYQYGYNTEYFGWCLNRAEFLAQAEQAGLTLVREFITGEHPYIVNAPEQCEYRGFLFRRSSEETSDAT